MFASAFMGPWIYIPFGFFALFPFRIFFLLLLFITVSGILVQGRIALKYFWAVRYQLFFFLLWFIYTLSSSFWIYSFEAYIKHVALLFIGLVTIFLMVYYTRDFENIKCFFSIWLLAVAVLIIVGLWEVKTGNHLSTSKFSGDVAPRFLYFPTGTFHNQNDYATFLTLSIPFAISVFKYSQYIIQKIFCFSISVFASYLVIVTSSRANMLALFLTISVALILFWQKSKRKGIFLAILLAIALIIAFAPKTQEIATYTVSQIASLAEQATNSKFDGFDIRLNLIRNGLAFCADTFFLGVGAGNTEYWMENFRKFPTGGHVNMHNWWFELLTEYGIFIFMGYAWMYLSVLFGLLCLRKYLGNKQLVVCDGLILSMVSFSLGSFSSSSVYAFLPHWLLLSLSIAFLNISRKNLQPFKKRHLYPEKDS